MNINYKEGKWANKILSLQHNDGSWGYFHSLSFPNQKQAMTTEQALRRLEILGFTANDKAIKNALTYMHNCLCGKQTIPDRVEKVHDWDVFTELLLATWIRRFTCEDELANEIAEKWFEIITAAFINGKYDNNAYMESYNKVFKKGKVSGGRLIDFVSFYQVSLLSKLDDNKIKGNVLKYIIEHETGIYYMYNNAVKKVPMEFKSKEASSYLHTIEILSEYNMPKLLTFVAEWLNKNAIDGVWDMGKESKDGVNYPLSDTWRNGKDRISDCTYRISKILNVLGNGDRNNVG